MELISAPVENPAIVEWFALYGQTLVYSVQILYWIAVGFAAVFAALTYRRFVDAKVAKAEREADKDRRKSEAEQAKAAEKARKKGGDAVKSGGAGEDCDDDIDVERFVD